MQTTQIPADFQYYSPAGAEVRKLMGDPQGSIAHCTLKDKKVSKAVRHKTVSEFWHVLSGSGELWRKNSKTNQEQITILESGVTIDIPVGIDFQYKSNQGDLVFICVTMPAWPGQDEVSFVEHGPWEPTFPQ